MGVGRIRSFLGWLRWRVLRVPFGISYIKQYIDHVLNSFKSHSHSDPNTHTLIPGDTQEGSKTLIMPSRMDGRLIRCSMVCSRYTLLRQARTTPETGD